MTQILIVGATANAAAYILTRWWVFGLVAAGCAVGAAIVTTARLVLDRPALDCCPHDGDDAPTQPLPVVEIPPCRGCRSAICPDCTAANDMDDWEVVTWR